MSKLESVPTFMLVLYAEFTQNKFLDKLIKKHKGVDIASNTVDYGPKAIRCQEVVISFTNQNNMEDFKEECQRQKNGFFGFEMYNAKMINPLRI